MPLVGEIDTGIAVQVIGWVLQVVMAGFILPAIASMKALTKQVSDSGRDIAVVTEMVHQMEKRMDRERGDFERRLAQVEAMHPRNREQQ